VPLGQAADILLSGLFAAAVFFLVSVGLQLVFGVQKIFNLAVGSFYALGAFTGITAVQWASTIGLPPPLLVLALVAAGLALAILGPPIEFILRTVYGRDEAFQLLLTFAIVLIFEDVTRMIWGTLPLSTGNLYLAFGTVSLLGSTVPVYNLIVIGAAIVIALVLSWMLTRTGFGRIIRATADNWEMSAAMGVDVRRTYVKVFTMGTALSTLGGALVIPSTATMSEMGIELIVIAFAIVVIGGLGSMLGALVGALLVGLLRAFAIFTYPPIELLLIYLIVIAVLVLKPQGLFGREPVT
jgi:branched-chain amino acid transport system permease protein